MAVRSISGEMGPKRAVAQGPFSPIRRGSICRPPSSLACCFSLPTVASLFFSLTRWTLFDAEFIGLANFVQFFQEPFLVKGLVNTLI